MRSEKPYRREAADPFHAVRRTVPVVALLAAAALASSALAEEALQSLRVHPAEVALDGAHAYQRIVVHRVRGDGTVVDVTRQALLESAHGDVARISSLDDEERPAIVPAGDGETRAIARLGELAVEVPVRVRSFRRSPAPSFIHDVVARLTRAGCNSGSCHGAQHGRGGFKLSLLGYEPDADFDAILEGRGRRLNVVDADASLLLAKPLGRLPHEGGTRFESGSLMHDALRRWVESRAPAPRTDSPRVERLDIFPRRSVLAVGEEAFLLASARLTSGSVEDVTGRALLASLNDGVATVDEAGRIVAVSAGETAVMVRYQGHAEVVRVTVPYRRLEAIADFEPRSFIDELARNKWQEIGLQPSTLSSDGEFIRRVFLVAIGTLPEAGEVRAFLDDDDPDKRDKLIDAVLDRPEYVDYWALKWGDILRINRTTMNEKGMWSMYNWVRAELRENRPLDRMVGALLTAQGSTYTSGPTNFFRVAQRPNDLAETTAQVFLGVRLQCAQCHHHPFEKWSQEDYWGLAAYFARLGIKRSSEFGVYGREQVVYVKKSGEVKHPKTSRVVKPKPLDAQPEDDPTDRRRALARWLTSKDNRLFARNLANRFWSYLMGRGIVEPVDDLRVTNPPSNPELLEALADSFVESGFDQKAFIRAVLRSRVFQLSSTSVAENHQGDVFFSRYPIHRLPAEVLHDALCAVTEVAEAFRGLPAGSRAIQLPDPQFKSYFLDSFGKPKRAIACECERVSQPNMAQALHLINGDFIQKRVTSANGRVARSVASDVPDETVVEDFYLAAFARRPSTGEIERAREFIAAAPTRKEGLEDLLWALCNSTEFFFNH